MLELEAPVSPAKNAGWLESLSIAFLGGYRLVRTVRATHRVAMKTPDPMSAKKIASATTMNMPLLLFHDEALMV